MLSSPDEIGLRALGAALDALAAADDPDDPEVRPMLACVLAAARLAGAPHASITVVSATHPPRTLAATGPVPSSIDDAQYAADGGPCLDAAVRQAAVVADLAEDTRWPDVSRHALEQTDVRHVLSCPLLPRPEGASAGSLNLYSGEHLVPGPGSELAVSLCAAGVNARGERVRADNLELALRSARSIGAAVGVLMAQRKITYDDAFSLLRSTSQSSHRKLREIASEVLLTGELPA